VKGFRSRFIFTFVVYFLGFASAIYVLAPPPEGQDYQYSATDGSDFNFDSQEFVKSFNSGMHKCVDFGKEATLRTVHYIREKIREQQLEAES
jgi:hypothetical protein